MPDCRSVVCDQQQKLTFDFRPQRARYVKFAAKSYYGILGAGLQFFDIVEARPCDLEEDQGKEENQSGD